MADSQKLLPSAFEELVVPRFLRYVRVCTTSDRSVAETPSSPGQWELARLLAEELSALGLETELTAHCYVLSRLPASSGCEAKPVIGFLAHLDTAEDVSGKDVKPLVEERDGEKIIRSDGTTLLGADDKAGIAEIMGAVDYLLSHPEIKHGTIEVIFSPDEETGRGLPFFPSDKVKAQACYTLDGGPLGEIECECFNGLETKVHFSGRVIHLGYARGELANACLMAAVFAAMLPRSESPEATDGYYGYYCPIGIKGGLESAVLEVLIRDFSLERAKERAAALEVFAKAVEAQFPGGRVTLETKIQYYNMRDKIGQTPEVLEKLEAAALRLGVRYDVKPIRGGTDGARLTEMGIPTPNIFAGSRAFHSVNEWVPVLDMTTSAAFVVELAQIWAE